MPDMKPEREFYESTSPESIEKFIENGIKDQAEALVRSSIVPGLSVVTITKDDLETDEQIAFALSKIEVVDPHFQKIDLSTPEGMADGVILTEAKAISASQEATDPEAKSAFKKFQDNFLDNAGKVLARVGGKKALTAASLVGVVAGACSPVVGTGPVIPVEGSTSTATEVSPTAIPSTPTATATEAPTPTPTPEVAFPTNYDAEKFRSCYIPPEPLFDKTDKGYLYYLKNYENGGPFDEIKLKFVKLQRYVNWILYDTSTNPDYSDPETRPFRRQIFCYTTYEGIDYLVSPVQYYVEGADPKDYPWVIVVSPFYSPKVTFTTEIEQRVIKAWTKSMNFPVIITTNDMDPGLVSDKKDPLTSRTFKEHPDMQEKFDDFIAGDPYALDGLVLGTVIGKNSAHWFE